MTFVPDHMLNLAICCYYSGTWTWTYSESLPVMPFISVDKALEARPRLDFARNIDDLVGLK